MKKLIGILMIFSIVAFSNEGVKLDCQESSIGGGLQANRETSIGYFIGGFLGGFLGGIIGLAIATPIGYLGNPVVYVVPKNANYSCFLYGYSEKKSTNNGRSALSGSLLGIVTVFFVFLLVATE